MASKEELTTEELANNGRARRAISLWASMYDALFQDFLEMGLANDKLGTIIASARLAQLSSYCMTEFHSMAEGWCDSPTEAKAASEASEKIIQLMDRQLALIFPTRDSSVLDTVPRPESLS